MGQVPLFIPLRLSPALALPLRSTEHHLPPPTVLLYVRSLATSQPRHDENRKFHDPLSQPYPYPDPGSSARPLPTLRVPLYLRLCSLISARCPENPGPFNKRIAASSASRPDPPATSQRNRIADILSHLLPRPESFRCEVGASAPPGAHTLAWPHCRVAPPATAASACYIHRQRPAHHVAAAAIDTCQGASLGDLVHPSHPRPGPALPDQRPPPARRSCNQVRPSPSPSTRRTATTSPLNQFFFRLQDSRRPPPFPQLPPFQLAHRHPLPCPIPPPLRRGLVLPRPPPPRPRRRPQRRRDDPDSHHDGQRDNCPPRNFPLRHQWRL